MDETRREMEEREDAALAPYALRSARAERPLRLDPEGRLFDYRTEYQRDRDRILHARAFRRLRLKAEGGALGPSERRRDRLTHTLEAAQLARTIARALSLNEDLAESIALAHDLGSPPLGRDGARALHEILTDLRPPLHGGFQAHLQSLRVVDLLEKRYDHPGLNLTHEVRDGLLRQDLHAPSGGWRPPVDGPPSLEAQAVRVADRIASTLGDLDDALRHGEIESRAAERIPLIRALIRRLGARYPARAHGQLFIKANLIHRGLTHLLVTSTIQQSRRTLKAWCRSAAVEDHESFLRARASLPDPAVTMGGRTLKLLEGLQGSLEARLQASAAAARGAARARFLLGALFESYRRDPRLLDDYVLLRFKEAAGGSYLRDLPPGAMETEIARRYHDSGVFLRLVADHIAGMTDAYAASEHGRLFGSSPATGAGGHRS